MARVILRGVLTSRTGLHVGSGAGDATTDALLRRDAQGDWLIPGTALAGALRSVATRLAPRLGGTACQSLTGMQDGAAPCGCLACRLFGDIRPTHGSSGGEQAKASALWVENLRLLALPSGAGIRDMVGIDRVDGSPARAARAKYDLEVLPAGARFQLHLELESGEEALARLLAAALAEWLEGRAWIGGRAASGLGAFELENLECSELELAKTDALMAFLRGDEPGAAQTARPEWLAQHLVEARRMRTAAKADLPVARCYATFLLSVQAQGPLLVNDATQAALTGFDSAPLRDPQGRVPLLPGSGLRGVLRTRAERIARTLASLDHPDAAGFAAACPACSPLAREQDPLASCDALLRRQKARTGEEPEAHLCLGCRLFGSPRRGSRLLVEDALLEGDAPMLKPRDFVALDRFTGGASGGAKFDALALWKPRFAARIHLADPEPWELGWLALVLRDLAEGQLTLGMGRSKGFGRVVVPQLEVRVGAIEPEDFPGGACPVAQGAVESGLYQEWRWVLGAPDDAPSPDAAAWLQMANSWIAAWHEEVERWRWPGHLPARRDSYFGTAAASLYPLDPLEVTGDGDS